MTDRVKSKFLSMVVESYVAFPGLYPSTFFLPKGRPYSCSCKSPLSNAQCSREINPLFFSLYFPATEDVYNLFVSPILQFYCTSPILWSQIVSSCSLAHILLFFKYKTIIKHLITKPKKHHIYYIICYIYH